MATAHACAALVDVFPDLLRTKRVLVGTLNVPTLLTLATVHQHGAMRLTEVAEHLALDLSTVSRQVAHLRREGLLDSSPDPADGRSQRLSVTAEGVQQLRAHRRGAVDRLVERLAAWPDEDVGDLTRLLTRLARTTDPASTPAAPPAPDTRHHHVQEKQLQGNA